MRISDWSSDVCSSDLNSQEVAAQRSLILNGIMLAAAVGFTIIGFVIVQWRVSGPIQRMTGAMKRLADRDLEVIIPYVDRGAEIGEMAGAVQVFKDSMIARERAEAEITQQRADRERPRLEARKSVGWGKGV